jgi:hypothetical protein
MVTIATVRPHGKTSVRFGIVRDEHPDWTPYECTEGELRQRFVIVAADYKHDLPPIGGRIQRMIDTIDTRYEGQLPYMWGNLTEIPFYGHKGELMYQDTLILGSPFGSSDWTVRVFLWGAESIELKASRDAVQAEGGHLWPAFKPMMQAAADNGGAV